MCTNRLALQEKGLDCLARPNKLVSVPEPLMPGAKADSPVNMATVRSIKVNPSEGNHGHMPPRTFETLRLSDTILNHH